MPISRPGQLDHQRVSALHVDSSLTALCVHTVDSSGTYVSPGAGSTQVSIREILSSSGGSLIDSTNVSLGVTIRAGSASGIEYTDGDIDLTITGKALLFDNSSGGTLRPVTSARGLPTRPLFSSTQADNPVFVADVSTAAAPASGSTGLVVRFASPFADSTNNAIRVFQVASSGGASSTEVTIRQSTYTDLNTLSRIGDRDSTANVAAVLGAAPASTVFGLAVREVAQSTGPFAISSVAGRVEVGDMSTAVAPASGSSGLVVRFPAPLMDSTNNAIRVFQVASSGGASSTEVTVRQSTRADLQATVGEYSTGVPATGSTGLIVRLASTGVRVINSSAADLLANVSQASTAWAVQASSLAGRVLVDQNSTVWVAQVKLQDSSGVTASITNSTPSTAAQGLVVRPVVNGINSTTVAITSTNSTAFYSLISSVAGARQKVFAYGIFSTHTVPSTFVFFSSTSSERWAVGFGSGSSGMTGANLGISPPAWLFNTDAAASLQCRVEGGSSAASTVIVRVSIAWFSEA